MPTLNLEDFKASQRTMDPNLVSEAIIDLLESHGDFGGNGLNVGVIFLDKKIE